MATGVGLAKRGVVIVRLEMSAIKLEDIVHSVRLDGSYHRVPVCMMFLVPMFIRIDLSLVFISKLYLECSVKVCDTL